MALLKIGRITTDPHGRAMIYTDEGEFDMSEAKCMNFPGFSGKLVFFPCLYESNAWEPRLGDYPFYTGRLYLFPVNADALPETDTVEVGQWVIKLKVFLLDRGMTKPTHIWDGWFLGRKLQFYMPMVNMPLAAISGLLLKEQSGTGVFMESLCAADFDKIPLNFHFSDDPKKVYSKIKGSEMSTYKLPWDTRGSDLISNAGRPLDWNKSCQENNIQESEVLYCRLLRPGNNLTAYGGSAAPDYKLLGLEFLLGSLF